MQSQGRLLQKMRFMPSSLSSRSHRLLTALVDSQNKKTIKMQTWIDENDPEKVKEEREKVIKSSLIYIQYLNIMYLIYVPVSLPS